jgi:hypothetical protein
VKLTKSQIKQMIREALESPPTPTSEDTGSRFEELIKVKEIMSEALKFFQSEENRHAVRAMTQSLEALSAAMSHMRR